jgi:hypothetical protein
MQCPRCRSQMFIAEETTNSCSHVTFYRCSLCVGEHVSSAPVEREPVQESTDYSLLSISTQRVRPQFA